MKKLNPRQYRLDDYPYREHTQRYRLNDSAREARIKANEQRVQEWTSQTKT